MQCLRDLSRTKAALEHLSRTKAVSEHLSRTKGVFKDMRGEAVYISPRASGRGNRNMLRGVHAIDAVLQNVLHVASAVAHRQVCTSLSPSHRACAPRGSGDSSEVRARDS